jgi:hypothetical protein
VSYVKLWLVVKHSTINYYFSAGNMRLAKKRLMCYVGLQITILLCFIGQACRNNEFRSFARRRCVIRKLKTMSVVTNLILIFPPGEDETERRNDVNSFRYSGKQMNLVSIDFDKKEKGITWCGGTKFMEARIYMGAFNHLDLSAFLNHLRKIRWEDRDCVQLIVKEQDDDKFRIIELD